MAEVISVTDSNYSEILKKPAAVIVYGALWCGPCKRLLKNLEDVAPKYNGSLSIGFVNLDNPQESQELKRQMNGTLRQIPCTVFYRDGKEIDRMTGLISIAGIYLSVMENLDVPFPEKTIPRPPSIWSALF